MSVGFAVEGLKVGITVGMTEGAADNINFYNLINSEEW